MDTSRTASLVGALRDHATCKICFNDYSVHARPFVVVCQNNHSFCKKCEGALAERGFPCALCKAPLLPASSRCPDVNRNALLDAVCAAMPSEEQAREEAMRALAQAAPARQRRGRGAQYKDRRAQVGRERRARMHELRREFLKATGRSMPADCRNEAQMRTALQRAQSSTIAADAASSPTAALTAAAPSSATLSPPESPSRTGLP